jgi:hypothetical protein
MSITLRGRLVFRQAGPAVPLHSLTLEARHPGMLGGGWVRTTTDLDGRFAVTLHGRGERIELRWIDVDYHYAPDGTPALREREGEPVTWPIPSDSDDLGELPMPFWPYRDETPVPRAAAVDGKLPQAYTKGFFHTLELAFARTLPAKGLLEGMRLLGPGRPTAAEIQAHQPIVRSIRADQQTPGISRSDAWLGDMLLNGFHIASVLGRDATRPHLLRSAIVWGDMASRTDGDAFDLTDVDVLLDPRGAEVMPVEIGLRIRSPGPEGWASDRRLTVRPGEPDWEAAKRVVRCQYLLQGALDGHIITAHFQTEAAAIATFRNLRQSPLRLLLHGHLQEIVPQGHDGDSFAWGPKGILMAQSALTYPYVQQRMRRLSASMCWQSFAVVPQVHPTHRYAIASALYWDMLGIYLGAFFEQNRDEIVAHWPEVRRFSDDWVRSSVPYEPLPPHPDIVPLRESPEVGRLVVDGVLRSVPPVTMTDTPAPGDLERLLQACRTILFRATFDHTWTHDGQYDAGGDLLLATFGLRAGSLGPEDSGDLLPPPAVMLDAISTNSVGIHANYGMLLADEEHDVAPALKALLAERRQAFAALGVDVDKIRSRINI